MQKRESWIGLWRSNWYFTIDEIVIDNMELQKEQAATEISLMELGLGKKIKSAPKKKWIDAQERLKKIVGSYSKYKDSGQVIICV